MRGGSRGCPSHHCRLSHMQAMHGEGSAMQHVVTFLVCSVGGKRGCLCTPTQTYLPLQASPHPFDHQPASLPPSLPSACHDLTSASPPSPSFLPPTQPTGPHLLRRRRRLHKLLQGFGGHRVQLLAGTCVRRPAHGVPMPECGKPGQCSSAGGSLATGGCKDGA